MTQWIRFEHGGGAKFGSLEGSTITVHEGDLFQSPRATGETLALDAVTPLTPTQPTKMLALWNNFHALAAKLELTVPPEPLYFMKANNSFLPGGGHILRPPSYGGKVIFEGELGIVIGKVCRDADEKTAEQAIFGYTCINDVTAVELLYKDSSFPQWTRSKGFDTFGVFGPVVATGLNPSKLSIKTVLNGDVRQDYPVSDMVFAPVPLVSLISRDMTLLPGDVIACGTSVGVGSMKPNSEVSVTIEGIGTLSNRFD